jgi:hypothetical protein
MIAQMWVLIVGTAVVTAAMVVDVLRGLNDD